LIVYRKIFHEPLHNFFLSTARKNKPRSRQRAPLAAPDLAAIAERGCVQRTSRSTLKNIGALGARLNM